MAAPAILHDLIRAGVEFESDGERIRWRNASGLITPAVVDDLRSHKAQIISFLSARSKPSVGWPTDLAAGAAAAFADYEATDDPYDERAWQ